MLPVCANAAMLTAFTPAASGTERIGPLVYLIDASGNVLSINATMTPGQAPSIAKGTLVAMAGQQPGEIGALGDQLAQRREVLRDLVERARGIRQIEKSAGIAPSNARCGGNRHVESLSLPLGGRQAVESPCFSGSTQSPTPERRAFLPRGFSPRKVAKAANYLPFPRVMSQEGIRIDVDLQPH